MDEAGFEFIDDAYAKLKCSICPTAETKKQGYKIECSHGRCKIAFHVTCAQRAGLHMSIEDDGADGVRASIAKQAYYEKEAQTEDAIRVGMLHVARDRWADDSTAWLLGGGYDVADAVVDLGAAGVPTLTLWGREDEVIPAGGGESSQHYYYVSQAAQLGAWAEANGCDAAATNVSTPFDGEGRPLLTDFGLAKVFRADGAASETRAGGGRPRSSADAANFGQPWLKLAVQHPKLGSTPNIVESGPSDCQT